MEYSPAIRYIAFLVIIIVACVYGVFQWWSYHKKREGKIDLGRESGAPIEPTEQLNEGEAAIGDPQQADWSSAWFSPPMIESLILLTSVGLVAVSLWLLQRTWETELRWLAWATLIGGLVIFITAIQAIGNSKPSIWIKWFDRVGARMKLDNWQVFSLALGSLIALVAFMTTSNQERMNDPGVVIVSWMVSIALVVLGGWDRHKRVTYLPKRIFWLLVGLIVLALVIRIVNLDHIPTSLSGDEGSVGLYAIRFLKGEVNNLFRVGWFSFPSLYFVTHALPIYLFGQTAFALRLTSVIVGAITVGSVFLVARAMFGDWTGLFSAIALMAFHFHIHFSRLALNNIWDGLWFVLVIGLFWYGWERENRNAILLAGLALGIGQYFYVSIRILPGLLLLFILFNGLLDRSRFKNLLPSLLLMSLVFVVVILPLTKFYMQNPDQFMAPLNRVGVLGKWIDNEVVLTGQPSWRILLRQIGLSLSGFSHTPIRGVYEPRTPLLRPVPAALFLLGIGLLIIRIRESRSQILLLWIISFALIGGLSQSPPTSQRLVAVAPAVAIIIGYCLGEICALLGRLWTGREIVIQVIILSILLVAGFDELRFYFFDYTARGDFGGANTIVAQRLADFLQTKDGSWRVVFFGKPRMGYYSLSSLPYLVPQISGIDMNQPWGSSENPPVSGDKLIFVFLPDNYKELENVKKDYPGGNLHEELFGDSVLFWLYEYNRDNYP